MFFLPHPFLLCCCCDGLGSYIDLAHGEGMFSDDAGTLSCVAKQEFTTLAVLTHVLVRDHTLLVVLLTQFTIIVLLRACTSSPWYSHIFLFVEKSYLMVLRATLAWCMGVTLSSVLGII